MWISHRTGAISVRVIRIVCIISWKFLQSWTWKIPDCFGTQYYMLCTNIPKISILSHWYHMCKHGAPISVQHNVLHTLCTEQPSRTDTRLGLSSGFASPFLLLLRLIDLFAQVLHGWTNRATTTAWGPHGGAEGDWFFSLNKLVILSNFPKKVSSSKGFRISTSSWNRLSWDGQVSKGICMENHWKELVFMDHCISCI